VFFAFCLSIRGDWTFFIFFVSESGILRHFSFFSPQHPGRLDIFYFFCLRIRGAEAFSIFFASATSVSRFNYTVGKAGFEMPVTVLLSGYENEGYSSHYTEALKKNHAECCILIFYLYLRTR
jgi:hypothetical protein